MNTKKLIFILAFTFIGFFGRGQTTLSAGDVAFTHMNTDTPDGFSFVLMVDVTATTQIVFTDNAWNGSSLASNENTATWIVPSGGLTCGTVVTITDPGSGTTSTVSSGHGTCSGRLSGLSSDGDQILAYQGSSSSPSFIAGISLDSTGWITSGAVDSNKSYLPSPLVNGTNAFAIATETDNAKYSGTTTSGTKSALLSSINNNSNWTSNNSTLQYYTGTFTVTDCGGDTTAPTVTNYSPTDNATGVAISSDLVLTFSENVVVGTSGNIVIYNGGGTVFETIPYNDPRISFSTDTVTINPTATFVNNSNYYVQIGANTIRDAAGNFYLGISDTTTWNFTTISATPTINTSVSSLTGFTYVEGSGPSTEQSFEVSGSNLTANLTITPPTNWEISTASGGPYQTTVISLSPSGGTVGSTPIYTRMLSGLTNAGSPYSGDIACASTGATTQNVVLDGTVTAVASGCSELFISEYCEGSSNNKYIEIYNPTNATVDLSSGNYRIEKHTNGGTGSTSTLVLSGSIAAYDVLVIANNQSGVAAAITAAADITENAVTAFNGDDVIELQKNTGSWTLIDAVGVNTGSDPGTGWSVAGTSNATADHTLVRKSTIDNPNNIWSSSAGTDSTDSEWIVYNQDTFTNIGSHTSICGGATAPEINITGNSTNIINGDATPDVADHTNFGSVDVSTGSQAYTFTIQNLGSATLNIDSVTSDNSEFAVSAISTPNTVGSSASTTFIITFNPASTGVRSATITIENNDSDEDPYTFAVQGTGVNSTESDIIAVAASEAVSISSLENDATVSAITDGTQVWQFTIRDGGTDLTDADTYATIVTALTFAQGSGNQVTTWTDAIQSIALFDGSAFIANATVTANQIQFTGLNINVADGTQKTISVRLSLKNPLGADAFDGEDFVFSLSNANATASSAGSSFSSFAAAASTNGSNVIDVTATQLSFSVQPTDVGVGSVMNPHPAVKATDVNGNLDLGFTGNVALTSTGTETVTTPVTAVAGIATFTDLSHSVIGTNLTLSATTSGLTGVNSITFDVLEQTTFQVGDLAILAVNTDIDNDPEGSGNGSGDQIVFVIFKDITQGTKLYITDNGYERELAGKWGNTEGVIAITRTGSTLAKGTVITLEANASTNGNILSSNHFSIFTCGSLDSNWSKEYVAGTGGFNLNSDDDVWIMQGGTWTNGNSGNHDATYDGTVLYGWTESGWNDGIGPGSDGPKWSNLIEGMSCFSTEVTGDSKVKFDDPVDPDFSSTTRDQLDWVALINDTVNWDTYTDNSAYNAGGYNYKGNTTCPAITIAADTHINGKWVGTNDNNWFNCANWDYLKVPDETVEVIISGAATNEALVDADATDSNLYGDIAKAKNLTIQNGNYVEVPDATDVLEVHSNLTIDSGAALYMNGSTTVDGNLHLYGNWINNAAETDFDEGESTVHFVGTTAQTVTCNTGMEVEHFYNVVLNNPTGFTTDSFNSDLHAEGSLTLTQGNLTVKSGYYALAANNLTVATGSQIQVENQGSLIQTGTGVVTGGDANAFKVTKTTGTYYNYDYIYWSSPVEGLNIQDVFSSTNGFNNYKYKFAPQLFNDQFSGIRTGAIQTGAGADGFDDEGDDWTAYSSGVMDKGMGYIVMGQGSPSSFSSTNINTTHSGYTVNFTGQKVNNGSIDVTLYEDKYNLDGGTVPNAHNINLNLVGNPYPSAISLPTLYNVNSTNIEPNFYFWTHEHPISNAFLGPWGYNFSNDSMYSATVSGSSVTTTNPFAANPLGLDYTYVASGQAFFVQAKNTISSGTTTLNFNNSMRDVTYTNTSFRNVDNNNDESLNRIWLSMTETNGDKNFIALGFGADNTDDLSLNDVFRMDSGNDTEFYSLIPQVQGDFDIQFLSEFSNDKTIPLGMEILTNGNYSIQLEQTEGVFLTGQSIYLEDTYENVIHDLGMGAYTFTQTDGTNINDRFVLRFTTSALGNEETALSQVKVYPNPSTGVFNVAYYGTATLQYTVYDLTGKTVFSGTGNQINLTNQAKGMYFAKITDGKSVRTVKLVRE